MSTSLKWASSPYDHEEYGGFWRAETPAGTYEIVKPYGSMYWHFFPVKGSHSRVQKYQDFPAANLDAAKQAAEKHWQQLQHQRKFDEPMTYGTSKHGKRTDSEEPLMNGKSYELEDKLKGRRNVNDMGPWEALASELLDKTDGPGDLKPQMEDDSSIVPDDEQQNDNDQGTDDDGAGLSASDGQQFTDDGGTSARDAYEWESTDHSLKEMFDLTPPERVRYPLKDILQAYIDEDR